MDNVNSADKFTDVDNPENLKGQEEVDEDRIKWINVIFLPFNPLIQRVILFTVILKCALGPVQAVYPQLFCEGAVSPYVVFEYAKFLYIYASTVIYGIELFLHIVHRQVTEEAVRREYAPKPLLELFVDAMSLLPLLKLFSSEVCPGTQLWPNILCFVEFLIIYRVIAHFSLVSTHSILNISVGYFFVFILTGNCVACFYLLLTYHGMCQNCGKGLYDWRLYVLHKIKKGSKEFTAHVYMMVQSVEYLIQMTCLIDNIRPSTYCEYVLFIIFLMLGYIFYAVLFAPKIFCESVLRMRLFYTYYPRGQRIIEETKRRNPSEHAYLSIKYYYTLIWDIKYGLVNVPIVTLPRYMRVDLTQDMTWPVFYHSPTLRNTSVSYKRFLCERVRPDFKFPNEKFFSGPHCFTNLYYLRSGIVQIISSEDSMSPVLSVTSGTIFGDISFYIPPLHRKTIVRCLTYCEILVISRADILQSLHKFPGDRRNIMDLVKQRVTHARTLFECKQSLKGSDRSEDEGIAWVKKRWWEIYETMSRWQKSNQKDIVKCELPPETAPYHCAKFIGQLVLCNKVQLQRNSIFSKLSFPWILSPHSSFTKIWNRLILVEAYCVLVIYPPNLNRRHPRIWFIFFQFCVDFLYTIDLLVSLITTTKSRNIDLKFITVLLDRCKTKYFLLDVLATPWLENFIVLSGLPQLYQTCKFNRLIKSYKIFESVFSNTMNNRDPFNSVMLSIVIVQYFCVYVGGFLLYNINRAVPDMTTKYLYGEFVCPANYIDVTCYHSRGPMSIIWGFVYENLIFENDPIWVFDLTIALAVYLLWYIVIIISRCRVIAALYLRYRNMFNYNYLVSHLQKHYLSHKIHPDLLKRLKKYLICQWKYFYGMDVLYPNILKGEPYDIYWKSHGEIAERIIGTSGVFAGANPALIRDLANKAKFLIVPRSSTLIVFGVHCKKVTWILNGQVKCEYHNDSGELVKDYIKHSDILSVSSVFLGTPALRTYTAATDCEILCLQIKDFFAIIQRYHDEWSYLETCINEFTEVFEELLRKSLRKHKDYQKRLRDKIFHPRKSVSAIGGQQEREMLEHIQPSYKELLDGPESKFIQYWLLFRMIIVIISILAVTNTGGSGAQVKWVLSMVSGFCDGVTLVDITVKMMMPYYDERGLIISNFRKSLLHYLSRSFVADVIGIFPMVDVLMELSNHLVDQNSVMLSRILCKYSHLYMMTGYFDYICDKPMAGAALMKVLKWQIVVMLLLFGTSSYLINACIQFDWDVHDHLLGMKRKVNCWVDVQYDINENVTLFELQKVVAVSLLLSHVAVTSRSLLFRNLVEDQKFKFSVMFIIVGCFYWYVNCYSTAILILRNRGSTTFEQGVSQLCSFLKDERVEKSIIDRMNSHFQYWWIRTKGVRIEQIMSERIGAIFRQDLNYYFYKKTLQALDTELMGGDFLVRKMCNIVAQHYIMPEEDIVREMDLSHNVYVVHRGKVVITRKDKKLAIISKGGIFGQLEGKIARPSRVTARSMEHVDLLGMPIKLFQELLSEDAKKVIADKNKETGLDYLTIRKDVFESPYNTIEYILGGEKTMKLPFMRKPLKARSSYWYSVWLLFVWFAATTAAVILSLAVSTLPPRAQRESKVILIILDVIHIIHFMSEFFTMELTVDGKKCLYKYKRLKKLSRWEFYVDLFSVVVPLIGFFKNRWIYHLGRALRIRLYYECYKHFCDNFQNKFLSILIKVLSVFLLFHALSCGWMLIGCRIYKDQRYPMADVANVPKEINETIDYGEWIWPHMRPGGCARSTKTHEGVTYYVIPKYWQMDYIVSFSLILTLYTYTYLDTIKPQSILQVYFQLAASIVLTLLKLWLTSMAISTIFTKFRQLYAYDYRVKNFLLSMKQSGVNERLLQSVLAYTKVLWIRYKDKRLPKLTNEAPTCLLQDMYSSLYMHHLTSPLLFRQLPHYFLRQLAIKLHRIVIFPGKIIVSEGDIVPTIYFIHEGEVEKWYTDASGEAKMASVLAINGYFGLMPGLFPNMPYQFSYYSRTVVDLVTLEYKDWQDLLNGYPQIKVKLYDAAKKVKQHYVPK